MSEAYPSAEHFAKNGYNAFVLQYRVAPYTMQDSYVDLQRAIRYIKYYGADRGFAYPERISVAGFSAGGMTIMGMLDSFEPDQGPSEYFTGYVDDEIDQIDAQVDVALNIYGALPDAITSPETKKLPQIFIAVGAKDETVGVDGAIGLYSTVADYTRTELHVLADGIHGIGLGNTWNHGQYPAFEQWSSLAFTFMDIAYGYQEAHIGQE